MTDGYTAPNGKKKESIGQLGSGILEQLKNNAGSATLQRQFDGVRNFLSNNMHARMMELFNPKEWEYLPYLSEQWLGFNDAQFGKQINQPDNAVKMAGRADLVFKKRKQQKDAEDEYFIVDMKNFGDGMSEESADYMRNQLYLYALADNFRKKTQNGETPETVASNVTRMGFLLPAQNEFREVEASPEVLETAHAKYSAAIAQIQGLAQQGLLDDYIRQIQRNIAGSLFGAGGALKIEGLTSEEIEKARDAYFANEKAQYTSNELSGATIGKTLVMHEDYKEYLDDIHAVTKFANKQDEKFGDSQSYNMWKINAKKIETAKDQARTLNLRGMTEEAAR